MKRIALNEIVFDAGTQVRLAIDQQVVGEYAEAMTAGDTFPPIVVFHDGTRHYLADGFHRFLAAQRNQFKDISADVRPGTLDDALWFALGANRQHAKNGLRLSRADKRRSAVLAIERWPDRSATSIAEQIGVHQTFVSDVRRDLKSALPDRVVGKDGKDYPATTAQSRITPSREREAVSQLRAGKGISEIAGALNMSTRTVQKIRQAAGIQLKRDSTRAGIEASRGKMRSMASEGYTSRQIAEAVGLSLEGCRDALRKEAIDVPADRVIGKSKHHDSARILERIVMDAENLTEGADLIDFSALNRAQIAEWVQSLQASRDKLGAFIRRLIKEQQHGEAA